MKVFWVRISDLKSAATHYTNQKLWGFSSEVLGIQVAQLGFKTTRGQSWRSEKKCKLSFYNYACAGMPTRFSWKTCNFDLRSEILVKIPSFMKWLFISCTLVRGNSIIQLWTFAYVQLIYKPYINGMGWLML